MESLYRTFEGAAHVSTIASLGFGLASPKGHAPQATFTLQQQIQHKAAFIEEHCLHKHTLPVVVVGHSIGFYMAMRAVRSLESEIASSRENGQALGSKQGRYGWPFVMWNLG